MFDLEELQTPLEGRQPRAAAAAGVARRTPAADGAADPSGPRRARPDSGASIPLVETHWSRILHCDLFDSEPGNQRDLSPWSLRPLLAAPVAAAARAIAAAARRAQAVRRQRRESAAMYEALRQLDDRALRDIGLHRSELRSLAADVHRSVLVAPDARK